MKTDYVLRSEAFAARCLSGYTSILFLEIRTTSPASSSKRSYSGCSVAVGVSGTCGARFTEPNFPTKYRAGGRDVLTQAEANHLLGLPKVLRLPHQMLPTDVNAGQYARELVSTDGTEAFVLNVNRKSIKISITSHFRQKQIGLARLCLNGSTHRNPGGAPKMGRTHLHVYAEGYDDKLAIELPDSFTDPTDLAVSLSDFCRYINLTAIVTQQQALGLGDTQ